jgi:hypothetical protein
MLLKPYIKIMALALSTILLIGCGEEGAGISGGAGQSGSRARFTVMGDNLYTVEGKALSVFNLTNPAKPKLVNKDAVTLPDFPEQDPIAETIFPLDSNTLIVGASDGAHFYDLSNPTNPDKIGISYEAKGCDPIVANQQYAFVSISSKRDLCTHSQNEIRVLDISNLQNIDQVNSRKLTNPRGLGLRKDQLFVADSGLKVYDVSSPNVRLVLEQQFPDVQAIDVITLDSSLLVIGKASFIQYRYTDQGLQQQSRITFNPSPYVE